MLSVILSVFSLILFCLSSRQLIQSIAWTEPLHNHTEFNRMALRIMRAYKVIAWSVMTISFLGALVSAYGEVFTSPLLVW